jgi:BON domain
MSPFRYRDEEPSLGSTLAGVAVGALAGFAVGVVVAQKVGGISGIASRLRQRFAALEEGEEGGDYEEEGEGYEEDELEDEFGAADVALEERVLEAFRNDPVLSERAIDIGAIGEGIIELSGWVDSEDEAELATTVARGTPGVDTVVNRLTVGNEDEMGEDELNRAEGAEEDPNTPLSGGRWEGQRVGTGRRRQGTSDEADRHADPKPGLEDRWLDEEHAIREAAGDVGEVAERPRGGKRKVKGDRTGGSPIAPTGVPKADHVADPEATQRPEQRAD